MNMNARHSVASASTDCCLLELASQATITEPSYAWASLSTGASAEACTPKSLARYTKEKPPTTLFSRRTMVVSALKLPGARRGCTTCTSGDRSVVDSVALRCVSYRLQTSTCRARQARLWWAQHGALCEPESLRAAGHEPLERQGLAACSDQVTRAPCQGR